jgi:hypothetical protein
LINGWDSGIVGRRDGRREEKRRGEERRSSGRVVVEVSGKEIKSAG